VGGGLVNRLCSQSAHAQKGWHGATREFPCSRSARPRKEKEKGSQTALRARRAPTMKQWSLDARCEGQAGPPCRL